jgi:hypothetical protein
LEFLGQTNLKLLGEQIREQIFVHDILVNFVDYLGGIFTGEVVLDCTEEAVPAASGPLF